MEIERKFLVNTSKWNVLEKPSPEKIIQAYLHISDSKVIRVRTKGKKGFLTIKGATIGISRAEYEYEIPLDDALELIDQFADKIIEKDRYTILNNTHVWEVDLFHGKMSGLILAEIELERENELFELPEWIGIEVSDNPDYFNSNLVDRC